MVGLVLFVVLVCGSFVVVLFWLGCWLWVLCVLCLGVGLFWAWWCWGWFCCLGVGLWGGVGCGCGCWVCLVGFACCWGVLGVVGFGLGVGVGVVFFGGRGVCWERLVLGWGVMAASAVVLGELRRS
ncbi:hypothetical protein RA268_27605, partial [Pseudomonas syringae pv. tagetis]